MSSSDSQPPLTRRQARERERAAVGGAQPVTPGAQQEPTSSGAVPSSAIAPSSAVEAGSRRRPGSHAAAVAPREVAAPAQAAVPASAGAEAALPPTRSVPLPPASATEIVPGTGMTRRQLRALRSAQTQDVQPVPLQAPSPQSSDRTVQDVLGSVRSLGDHDGDSSGAGPAYPTPFRAAGQDADDVPQSVIDAVAAQIPSEDPANTTDIELATAADSGPDAAEPLADAAAAAAEQGDEPRRHRSTWAPSDEAAAAPSLELPAVDQAEADESDDSARDDHAADAAGTASARLPLPSELPNPTTPEVFPLDLEDDGAAASSDREGRAGSDAAVSSDDDAASDAAAGSAADDRPAAAGSAAADDDEPSAAATSRAPEPKPVTTAFDAPSGHWSRQVDGDDSEIHDEETGVRRVADANPNAIILPNSALGDVTGALNATGEVILTGSIDLPKSLSSTGSHRPIDGVEVDRLLDQQDEVPASDATPVRASKAISSHTSTRAVVLAATKPKESRTPVILAVSAAVVGVAAVAALVIAGFVLHWL